MQEKDKKDTISRAVDVLNVIWSSIDFESMSNTRKKAIWSEFKSKARAAAISSNNLIEFVDKLCKKFNVQSIEKGYEKIVEIYEEDSENQVIETLRNELMIIMFKLRMLRDKKKEEYAKKQKTEKPAENYTFENTEDDEDEYFTF